MLRLVPLVLALLLAGCTGQALPAPAESATRTAADERVLQRWIQWTWSALPGTEYPELPKRDYCAPDPGSDLWFLDGQRVPGHDERWTCALPAGRSLVVVPSAAMTPDDSICERQIDGLLPLEGEATVDGEPVALRPSNPIEVDGTPPLYLCGLWGTTKPLLPGHHTIIISNIAAGKPGKATVEVTVN